MTRSAAVPTLLAALALLFSSAIPAADERTAARAALDEAEAAIVQAQEHQALWTTALAALKRSRSAWERGDWPAVLHWGREARSLAELGLEQAGARAVERQDAPRPP